MENKIMKSARVSSKAHLDGVYVGSYVTIEDDVVIGKATTIEPYTHIKSGTTIGRDNIIGEGAILGASSDRADNRQSKLIIGDNNRFFERVTIERGSKEETSTVIGSEVMIAHRCYIGGDSFIEDGVTMLNCCTLMGDNILHKGDFLSSRVTIERGVVVGDLTLIAFNTKVLQHILPFLILSGERHRSSFNLIGLKRNGYNSSDIRLIKNLYKEFSNHSKDNVSSFVKLLENKSDKQPCEVKILEFLSRYGKGSIGIRDLK